MKKKRFSVEQITSVLQQVASGDIKSYAAVGEAAFLADRMRPTTR